MHKPYYIIGNWHWYEDLLPQYDKHCIIDNRGGSEYRLEISKDEASFLKLKSDYCEIIDTSSYNLVKLIGYDVKLLVDLLIDLRPTS